MSTVSMLGVEKPLRFTQTEKGLVVKLTQTPPCHHAWTLCIQGRDLNKVHAEALRARN